MVGIIDMNSNVANSNKTDGIHPTENGYRFIALTIYDYLVAHQLATGIIICFGNSMALSIGIVILHI
ncbi:hypothetical protein AAKU52_003383 [Pedobacter sp. CG_S7]|uniref:hypothetical protein n=1 Tax=Pedobacter sp. CG_S7 TaxID=3143930 RepID=UPI00339A6411